MEFTEEELKYVPSELAYDYIKELEAMKKDMEESYVLKEPVDETVEEETE